MIVLFFLGVIAWSMLPYKTWSRGLLGGEGFNLGDVFLLMVVTVAVLEAPRWRHRTALAPWIAGLGCVLLVSLLKGVLEGESLREMGRVARGTAFWVILPVMLMTVRSRLDLRRWGRVMALLALGGALTIAAFSLAPSLIPPGDEVGALREETMGGFQRVFTLGMWAVFGGAVVALAAALFRRGSRTSAALLLAVLVVSLSFTFARTFVAGFAVAALVLLFLGSRETAGVLALALGVVAAAFVLPVLAPLGRAIGERSVMLFTAAPEYAFQTMFWRFAEYAYFGGEMHGFADWTFGVLGRVYTLPEGYTASMPHIAYFGILYAHGVAGAAVYAGFLIAVTIRLLRNASRARGTHLHWAAAGGAAAWIALLAGGMSAPVLAYAWGVAALAFAAGLSETAMDILRRDHAPLQHHHAVPERPPVHRGDGPERSRAAAG